MGSPSKRHFKQPFLFASSNGACSVNTTGVENSQRADIVGGTNGRSFSATKAGEEKWRAVTHLALHRSERDWLPVTEREKKKPQIKQTQS